MKQFNPTCGDLMFSGHNASALLLALIVYHAYKAVFHKTLRVVMVIFYIVMILLQGVISALQRA